MGRPAATETQRLEQRNRIRHAAAEVYREGGIPALSVRAIAKRAGVSTGLIYSYFADLSELLRSLWMKPVDEFGRQVETIVAAHPDPLARVEALLTAYVGWAHAHPDVYRGALLFVRPPTSPSPERQPVDELPLHRALCTAIASGQAMGSIRPGDAARARPGPVGGRARRPRASREPGRLHDRGRAGTGNDPRAPAIARDFATRGEIHDPAARRRAERPADLG